MDRPDDSELMGRLALLERMVAEGRRSAERWGWSFLLWGIGPLVAMLWASRWPHPNWAWPVTIGVCTVINGITLKLRKRNASPRTTTMRSIGAVWTCAGVTLFVFTAGVLYSGTFESRTFYAALFTLPAVAHGTSSLILRWPPQFLAALVWWLATLAAFVVPLARLQEVAIAALVLGNIVFGAYLTWREWSRRDA